MKILFITDNFPPELNAPASRTFEHCREWVKQGIDVTVITCFPNFPEGKVYKGYKNKVFQKENMGGIKVIRILSYISANQGFFRRTLDFISFAVGAFFVGLFCKTNLIVTTSPQFFVNFSGMFLKFFKRVPWVLELRDLWPESVKAFWSGKRTKIIPLFEYFEMKFYKYSDLIVAVTQSFKKDLTSRGIVESKIKIVTNGVDLSQFAIGDYEKEIKPFFTVGYVGTHGMAHKLDFILNAAQTIEKTHPDIQFLFVGGGAYKKKLLSQKKRLNLKNTKFIDFVPKNEVPSIINSVDVGLVNLKNSKEFSKVIPSKIFELAAMKTPIILGVKGESKALVEDNQIGMSFEPENESDFIKKLIYLKENKKIRENMQEHGVLFASKYSRHNLAQNMLSYMEEIQ